MSSRRQARAGTTSAATRRDGLPVALTSRHDPLWTDPAAVADLAARHGLTLALRHWRSLSAMPWFERFDAFRWAWCKAEGLMNPRWPNTFDWRRMREVGIDDSGSSRYRLRGETGA